MEPHKIPATVSILTRNSGAMVSRALESVKDFAEILVCDGGSTDDTLVIARTAGARIIPQNKLFQDAEGRLKDWSGVRNECLDASSYAWHFYLDSDEYATSELVGEMRAVISEGPAACWVPRKYVENGTIIERSLAYPNKQMRFFHRDMVAGFRKPVHERIETEPDATIRTLRSPMLVPVDTDIRRARAKMNRYIELELARHSPFTRGTARRMLWSAVKATLRSFGRIIPTYTSRGMRLPLAYDMLAVEYEWKLALRARQHL